MKRPLGRPWHCEDAEGHDLRDSLWVYVYSTTTTTIVQVVGVREMELSEFIGHSVYWPHSYRRQPLGRSLEIEPRERLAPRCYPVVVKRYTWTHLKPLSQALHFSSALLWVNPSLRR